MKITKQDLALVQAFLQTQILVETLDQVEDYSVGHLKALTKNYNNALKVHTNKVIQNMFLSNPEFYETLSNNLRQKINSLDKYFDLDEN